MSSRFYELSSLSDEKRALLALLLKERGIDQMRKTTLSVRTPEQEPVPSFAQESMWVLQQQNLSSPHYNVPASVRLRGPIQPEALRLSLQTVMQRHETLRTSFVMADGHLCSVISSTSALSLPVIDLHSLTSDEQEAYVLQMAREEAQSPFDLEQAPLLRAKLLRLSANEAFLLFTMHHSIADGWSMGILIQEVAECYIAYKQGHTPCLTDLPIQYTDYALWQRNEQQKTYLSQLEYWRTKLASAPLTLNLPTDHPRPALQTFKGARYSFSFPPSLAQALSTFSQREGVTLFMTLCTAFCIVLSRYTDQEEFLLGTPVAGRTHTELEKLIGCFVNTLVIRADLSGNPTFLELLQRTRSTCTEAYAHQELPFERLVEDLQPPRDPSRTPLFQVLFALQNMPLPVLQLDDVSLEPLPIDTRTAKTDLSLEMTEADKTLRGTIEYATDLFEEGTIARLVGHLQTLLANIVVHPQNRLTDLPFLTAEEQQQILYDWNTTAVVSSSFHSPHQLVEEQVMRTPTASAVVCGSHMLSYQELNERANRLAHFLRKQGVGPEVRVGLCVERSLVMMVGMLAILKAGGTYVPLDPTYPRERLSYMLADAQIAVLLTQEHLRMALPERFPLLFCLDSDWPIITQEATENLPEWSHGEQLMYIIYTSGSTGRPKGVAVPLRGFANLLAWYCEISALSANDRLLLLTSMSFDLTQKNIFAPLVVGGTLHLPLSHHYDPIELVRQIDQEQISMTCCTPSAFYPLVDALGEEEEALAQLRSLRYLSLGGEPIHLPRLRRWLTSAYCHAEVANTYGPTECSDLATFHRLLPATYGEEISVPLGKPLRNIQVFVLNKNLSPVPVGVAGDLYIGGRGVGRGYINRPDLTAERFIPHPFSSTPGARLYKTGDRARYQPDGILEFLGRSDHQLKIRGFRIELQEIESLLQQHPAVKDAAVMAHYATVDTHLIAYVTLENPAIFPVDKFRQWLKARLPHYMLPAAFVHLDAMPLTPNGKIDRLTLPAPVAMDYTADAEYVAPRTSTEDRLASIWCDILKVEHPGVYDNFFEIGGHSLLATQVVARIRETLHRDIPLQAFFQQPTIADLATYVETLSSADSDLPELVPHPRIAAPAESPFAGAFLLPASFGQQRLAFLCELDQRGNTAYHIYGGIKLLGSVEIFALQQALDALVFRHESLRTNIISIDGQWQQVIAPQAHVELVECTYNEEHDLWEGVQRYIIEMAEHPFDLEKEPLLQVNLLHLGEQEHVLLLRLHHLIADGWSIGVLWRELAELYTSHVQERPANLPSLPVQYADYALWQREWLQGEALQRQLTYWHEHLTDAPTALALPTDHARPPVQSYRGATCQRRLPADLQQALQQLSQQEGTTLFMTLLTAFQALLLRYSGQDDLLVGTPIANRQRVELEPLIGFFVNTLVLRGDLSGDPSFVQALQRTREVCLQAYAHQDLPFEKLVEILQPERSLSRSPLFQVLFALQNMPFPVLQLPGVQLEVIDLPTQMAHFDLSLILQEQADGLYAHLEYASDLFERETIEQFLAHYERLLWAALQQPHVPLSRLPLLSAPEQAQVLLQWGQGPQVAIPSVSAQTLFEQQVERTPEAVAVRFGEQSLSYRQLNQRANQLADSLQQRGVGAEVRVGICMQRSLELLVGLLGVWKAGGAYVPLDPQYPAERLGFMLQDAQVALVLSQQAVLDRLPEQSAPVVVLEQIAEELLGCSVENPVRPQEPGNLAYVLYTSGSTGTPKGVTIEHHSVVTLLLWARDTYTPGELAGVLATTSICFDLSVFEIFVPLSCGGCVLLLTNALEIENAPTFRQQATLLNTVPSALTELLHFHALFPSIQTVNLAGEPLSRSLVEHIYQQGTVKKVLNLYGPSEDTTYSTYTFIPSQVDEGMIPIGCPILNTRVYVLDAQMQLVPRGVAGELFIGGEGVARGYFQRPDLTAERFVPDPFSTQPGTRLYQTGDLVRYRLDGQLEFLGRLDQQVKVRGYRIELGEIEAAIRTHEVVQECVVIVREDQPGDHRLVAYLVPQAGQVAPEAQSSLHIREQLKRQLPAYMVPAALVFLEHFPLTSNGKVDRRALPVPEIRMGTEEQYVAPRTPLEEELATLWQELLGVERISIHDSFFDLGGHSLLATQVVARLRKDRQADIPLLLFFEYPTIHGFAHALEHSVPQENALIPVITPVSRATYRQQRPNSKEEKRS